MTTFIEIFLSDPNGQVLCLADDSGHVNNQYPIPSQVLLTDEEDLFQAAEVAFTYSNTASEGMRSLSVGDYLALTNDGTYILRCENQGWSMLMSDGEWEVM